MNKLIGVLAFVAGATVGSLLTWKLVKEKYEAIANDAYEVAEKEIESVKEVFSAKRGPKHVTRKEVAKKDEPLSPKGNADYAHIIRDYKYLSEEEKAERESPPEDPPEEDSPEEETTMATKRYNTPYIISLQEFSDGKPEYDKLTITYYEGDDTLADDGDEIVDDPKTLVGPGTLMKFGEGGSEDEDVVYVRNERLGTDFEILRRRDTYQEVVMGVFPDGK